MSQAFVQEKKYDNNNQPCALIVVENVDAGGFRFHFKNSWSEVKEFTHNGRKAYKIWVSARTRSITITNDDPAIGELRDYTFPTPVQGKKTYVMKLATVYSSSAQSQTLRFNITPPDAKLYVNDLPWVVSNGQSYQFVKLGSYSYRIERQGYVTDAGLVEVIDPNTPTNVNITLKKETSTLTIANAPEIEGATIFIDGTAVGTGAMTTGILTPGNHTLVIKKPHYQNYTQEFVIKSGTPITIEPKLVCIAAQCNISVAGGDDDTEVYVNNECVGKGMTIKCLLDPGANIIETRKPHHTTNKRQIDVNAINVPLNVTMQAPKPIYGSLSVESNVKDTEVWVDGVKRGNTPCLINSVLEGSHKVELRKSNYKSESYNIDIKENSTYNVKGTLTNIGNITVSVSHPWASLNVDGKNVQIPENGKYILEGVNGSKHYLTLYLYDEYTTASKTVTIGSTNYVYLELKRKYVKKRNFYFEFGGIKGGNLGATASMGWNINNFNMQLDWEYDFNEESIYFRIKGDNQAYKLTCSPSLLNLGIKFGYSILCGRRLSITPQIGAKYFRLSGAYDEYYDDYYTPNILLTGSLRIYLATGKNFGFVITPEYVTPIKKGDSYELISGYSESIKKMCEGFNLRAGFAITF